MALLPVKGLMSKFQFGEMISGNFSITMAPVETKS